MENKEKFSKKIIDKNQKRDYHLKYTYNITLEDYNKMFDEQNGCCKICNKHQSEYQKSFHVDHNHVTNKIRGLLCVKCNGILGYANDNVFLLKKVIKYLKEN